MRPGKSAAGKIELLSAIMNGTRVSRSVLARNLALSFPSVTRIVGGFVAAGIVIEGEKVEEPGRAGRKSTALSVRPDLGYTIGVDVEGLAVRAVVLDFANGIVASHRIDLDASGAGGPVDTIARRTVSTVRKQSGIPKTSLLGIGLGLPGYADSLSGGTRNWTTSRGLERVSFQADIEQEFALPVTVNKNVHCVALAESRIGPHAGKPNMAVVLARFGVGCAAVVDGKILDPGKGRGGEMGHTVIHAHGRQCICGQRGCLEAYAGGWALARKMDEGRQAEPGSHIPSLYQALIEGLQRGDDNVHRLLRKGCKYLGIGVMNLAHLLGSELVLVQGIYDLLGDKAEEMLNKAVTGAEGPFVRISLDGMGEFAGAIGAAMTVRDQTACGYFTDRIFKRAKH